MSGDIQPRKRKERRRKKDAEYTIQRIPGATTEEEDTGTPPPTLVGPSESPAENISIHVYKESSTGGHWCARIVFFILLAVLVGLTGIIIIEHRGTTDVDTPVSSSRWAAVFDGWVDESTPSHDEGPHDEEDHAEESGEEELKEDEEHEEDSAQEEASKEEEEDKDDELDEGLGSEEEQEEEEEEEEEEGSLEDTEASPEEEDEPKYDEERESAEDYQQDEEDEGIEEGEENDDDDQEEFENGVLEEVDNTNEEDDDDNKDEALNEFDTIADMEEGSEEQQNADVSDEFPGLPGVDEIDGDSAEPLEEVEDAEPEEDLNDVEIEPEEVEIEEESASVAVKFGVGVALVVAAHFVLVRRWNNVDPDISDPSYVSETPDLSRRNTIIPPPQTKTAIASTQKAKDQKSTKEQAKTYEDLRSKYKTLEADNVFVEKSSPLTSDREQTKNVWPSRVSAAKEVNIVRGQNKVISSDEEGDGEELEMSEGERLSGTEEYEVEEEEEEMEEEEEEEEEDEEIETVDDTELIAKLEAKYGKLPTPEDSEEEEEEEEEEEYEREEENEGEEEEDEDEDMASWKRLKAPKSSKAELESGSKSADGRQAKAKHEDVIKAKGGPKAYDIDNLSNIEDVIIQEESDSGMRQRMETQTQWQKLRSQYYLERVHGANTSDVCETIAVYAIVFYKEEGFLNHRANLDRYKW